MESTLLTVTMMIAPDERMDADITEALPHGVVTVADLRTVADFLRANGWTAPQQ